MMTDIPIIFSGPMVRAIMDDRKTMTRRIAYQTRRGFAPAKNPLIEGPWTRVQPGDRLWVRENWKPDDFAPNDPARTIHMADINSEAIRETRGIIKWRPSIHLPRNRSRLTLIVEAVKREPLQAISIADVIAEGIPATAPVSAFADLWRGLHGPKSWDDNPEVVAIRFRVIKANIDAEEARAAA